MTSQTTKPNVCNVPNRTIFEGDNLDVMRGINDIITRQHEYWVRWDHHTETIISVARGTNGRHLTTNRDNTPRNNLDDLPNR